MSMRNQINGHLPPRVESALNDARDELSHFDERARSFMNERPVAALLSAIAAGYLLARISVRL